MSKRIAVIIGAGPGLGASIAQVLIMPLPQTNSSSRAFAPTHSLALLSRSITQASLENLSLPQSADAHAFPSNGSAASLKAVFEDIKKRWPGGNVDVGVFNVGAHFSPGPFLERDEDALRANLDNMAISAYSFAQNFIRAAQEAQAQESESHPTLLFTAATMSIRGSAKFAHMAMPQFAIRALAQSLAREFHPTGIHVALVIVDGLIDTERVRGMMGIAKEGTRIDPDELAKTYLNLYNQPRSTWTHEMDVRPSQESF